MWKAARLFACGFVVLVLVGSCYGQLHQSVITPVADNSIAKDARKAAAKGLELLQASGRRWFEKQKCASCHHQFLPLMAVRQAREHGIRVDEEAARSLVIQSFSSLKQIDHAIQGALTKDSNTADPGLVESYSLVAADASGIAPNLSLQAYARLLGNRQRPDGHWPTTDMRPPQASSAFTATAITIRAVQLYSHPAMADDTRERVRRARQWLQTAEPKSTEDRSFQLLGLKWTAANSKDIQQTGRILLAEQHSDGGWAQLPGRSSDAYATGEALYSLQQAGVLSAGAEPYLAGVRYLLKTQKEDGSWLLQSRLHPPAPLSPPFFETGFPGGKDAFASAAATSWAVMAIVQVLPKASKQSRQPSYPEIIPEGLPAWVETVLFKSDSQIETALGQGFKAASATDQGTTALMMAIPDLNKTRLLLSHGADVHARAKSGYSAMMVASAYRGTAAILRLLINLGGEANPRQELEGRFGATPLNIAAFTGDVENVELLLSRDADPKVPFRLTGLPSKSPLALACIQGDIGVVKSILSHGGEVDQPDTNGITALGWAVLSGQQEAVKLLAQQQANLNHVDNLGMTALLYAAAGNDAEMAGLLIRLGADKAIRSKDGTTPLELARGYGNEETVSVLSR